MTMVGVVYRFFCGASSIQWTDWQFNCSIGSWCHLLVFRQPLERVHGTPTSSSSSFFLFFFFFVFLLMSFFFLVLSLSFSSSFHLGNRHSTLRLVAQICVSLQKNLSKLVSDSYWVLGLFLYRSSHRRSSSRNQTNLNLEWLKSTWVGQSFREKVNLRCSIRKHSLFRNSIKKNNYVIDATAQLQSHHYVLLLLSEINLTITLLVDYKLIIEIKLKTLVITILNLIIIQPKP